MKYVGKYRVLSELTLDTHDFIRDSEGNIHPDYDELYIECNRGARIKHSYIKNTLCYWTNKVSIFKSTKKKFDDNNIEYTDEDAGEDFIIYFNDKDMNKVAKLVGAKTTGKKISPFDSKNIPGRIEKANSSNSIKEPKIMSIYKVPVEDMKLYYDALPNSMSRVEKRQLTKQITKDFDAIIIKKKGSEYNPSEERDKLNMKPKEFIHYLGLWQDYIEYIKSRISK